MAICNLSRRRTPHLDATSYPGSQSSLLPRLSGIGWSRDPSYFGGFAIVLLLVKTLERFAQSKHCIINIHESTGEDGLLFDFWI